MFVENTIGSAIFHQIMNICTIFQLTVNRIVAINGIKEKLGEKPFINCIFKESQKQ